MRNRICRKTTIGLFLLFFLTGCYETADTPIVALKQDVREKSNIAVNKNLTIAEQVQAPEKYQYSFTGDGSNPIVDIDADVILPQAEGIKVKNVVAREFTKHDVEQIRQALSITASLEASRSIPQTWAVEEYLENSESGDYYYGLWMSNNRKSYNIEPIIHYYRTSVEQIPVSVPKKKIRKEAKDLLNQAGLSDFFLGGTESDSYPIDLDPVIGTKEYILENYILYYTRKIDGIPITYTSVFPPYSMSYEEETSDFKSDPDMIVTNEETNELHQKWSDERMRLVYDGKGLVEFHWESPYTISDNSDEYVFLLPFSEIKQIFESVISTVYTEESPEFSITTYIKIDQIRLGYMRIWDPENMKTGKLIPVWDFFGDAQTTIASEYGDKTSTEQNDPYFSFLTINAMDGTVMDRKIAY